MGALEASERKQRNGPDDARERVWTEIRRRAANEWARRNGYQCACTDHMNNILGVVCKFCEKQDEEAQA